MAHACGGAELANCLDTHVKIGDNVATGGRLTAIVILVEFDFRPGEEASLYSVPQAGTGRVQPYPPLTAVRTFLDQSTCCTSVQ